MLGKCVDLKYLMMKGKDGRTICRRGMRDEYYYSVSEFEERMRVERGKEEIKVTEGRMLCR